MTTKFRREEDDEDEKEIEVKVPLHFTLRDVVIAIGAIVTVVLAWSAYHTRISNLELRDAIREEQIREIKDEIREIHQLDRELMRNIPVPQQPSPRQRN